MKMKKTQTFIVRERRTGHILYTIYQVKYIIGIRTPISALESKKAYN